MENNYFVLIDKKSKITLERFHVCTWEFSNNSALIEFGGEIKLPQDITDDKIDVLIYVPWLSKKHQIHDLYDRLKDSENCRFIFNDSVSENIFLDDGKKKHGVIQKFASRSTLCITPITIDRDDNDHLVKVTIKLNYIKTYSAYKETSIYFRFYIETEITLLSTRKKGLTRSSIIYDFKINEKRNLPFESGLDFSQYKLCPISSCFLFNILPNSYNVTFFENNALKNIRTLEFESFKKYINDKRVKNNELVVVFNKKTSNDGYAFFSMFSKERIGAGQLSLAVLVNLICGILLFFPGYRQTIDQTPLSTLLLNLPLELYIAIFLTLAILAYFIWPFIINASRWIKSYLNF